MGFYNVILCSNMYWSWVWSSQMLPSDYYLKGIGVSGRLHTESETFSMKKLNKTISPKIKYNHTGISRGVINLFIIFLLGLDLVCPPTAIIYWLKDVNTKNMTHRYIYESIVKMTQMLNFKRIKYSIKFKLVHIQLDNCKNKEVSGKIRWHQTL